MAATSDSALDHLRGAAGERAISLPVQDRVAHLPGGLVLPYLERGSRSAPAVLLLHGITDSRRSFEQLMPHLPACLRAIAPTLRGHSGASRANSYGLRDFAVDVAAFMDTVAIESAIVVGHSMGASIAQRLAVDFPDHVIGLILIGGFASLNRNPNLVAFGERSVLTLTDPVDPDFVEAFQKSTLARPISEVMLDGFVQESLTLPASVWRGAWTGLAEADLTPELPKIAVPTLLIRGERDSIALATEQEIMLEALPSARLVTLADAGHAPHWEDAGQIAALIAGFTLDGIARNSALTT